MALKRPRSMAKSYRNPLSLPMDDSLPLKQRKPVPHAFVLEALAPLSPYTRPMFGCLAVYVKRSEEHTSELQSRQYLVCRLLLEKKKHVEALLTGRALRRSALPAIRSPPCGSPNEREPESASPQRHDPRTNAHRPRPRIRSCAAS